MIEALLVVLTIIFFDRVFPARTALADLRASRPTLEEVYRRYGWVSFPRTVLALLAMGAGIARFAVKLEGLWIDVAVAGAGACYILSATYDTHKAFRNKAKNAAPSAADPKA